MVNALLKHVICKKPRRWKGGETVQHRWSETETETNSYLVRKRASVLESWQAIWRWE